MMSRGRPFTRNDPRRIGCGRKKTYSQEVIDFIRVNSETMSDTELCEEINSHFNLTTTRQSIKSLRRYYKFIKGREKYKPCPLMTEKIKDGYVIIKISNDAKPANKNWKLKHTFLYEQVHGKVPKDCNVIFLDGAKDNFSMDNLAVVTDEEQIRLSKSKLRFNDPAFTQTGIAIVKYKIVSARRRKNEKKQHAIVTCRSN